MRIIESKSKIYWANSMFSQADREFNTKCAKKLQEFGYQVFLPQEASINNSSSESSPTAEDIFRIDTLALLNSDILVACIDQESLDCGVACEIGIAYTCGLPIIGFYTDIRQHRSGHGRMYKNLYVVGAIKASGEIVSNIEELLHSLANLSKKEAGKLQIQQNPTIQHLDSFAHRYTDFVNCLESWYKPLWTITKTLEQFFIGTAAQRIIEFGCGTGQLSDYFISCNPENFYVGYDKSIEMVKVANARRSNPNIFFTNLWTEVQEKANKQAFDVAIISFVLHDHPFPQQAIEMLLKCLKLGGAIIVVDLSSWDLPRLTDLLRRELVQPFVAADKRFDVRKLSELSVSTNCVINKLEVNMPSVSFPTEKDLFDYLQFFGIFRGMDLPLGIAKGRTILFRKRIREILYNQEYPFTDQRAFIVCQLNKLL